MEELETVFRESGQLLHMDIYEREKKTPETC